MKGEVDWDVEEMKNYDTSKDHRMETEGSVQAPEVAAAA